MGCWKGFSGPALCLGLEDSGDSLRDAMIGGGGARKARNSLSDGVSLLGEGARIGTIRGLCICNEWVGMAFSVTVRESSKDTNHLSSAMWEDLAGIRNGGHGCGVCGLLCYSVSTYDTISAR